jgi:hypothetical protein
MRRPFALVAIMGVGGCHAEAPTHVHTVAMELRPSTPGNEELFRFSDDEVVERLDGERVRVHFTRAGRNAVPTADLDQSGVPDYVELVAERYDQYLAAYLQRGFRLPKTDADLPDDNGGDGRFDVYLVDFFGGADGSFQRDLCQDGQCIGYAVQENDFAGYGYPSLDLATRILATHELFHAVQASYDDGQDVIFSEGTAVWATEELEPELDDFERFVRGYLADPGRPLNRPRSGVVVDPFAYGSALFFRFLTEKFDDPDLIRRLLERVVDGAAGVEDPAWDTALDRLLREEFASALPDAFEEFTLWNAFVGPRAVPGSVSYRNAGRYPAVATSEMSLPFVKERGRQPQLSARYYQVLPRDRAHLEARLVGDTEGLSLHWIQLFPRNPVITSDETQASISADPMDGEVLLAVVNSNLEGPSRRASLCVGHPQEVSACVADLNPPEDPMEDAPDDDEEGERDPSPADPAKEGAGAPPEPGGCAAVPRPVVPALMLWALLATLFRRRRHCPRAGHPHQPTAAPVRATNIVS